MSNDQIIQPRITVLDEQHMSRAHENTLRILTSVGLEVDSERALEVFAGAGAEVDGSRVRIPADLVQWALGVTPSSIDIYDRRGDHAFRIGDEMKKRGLSLSEEITFR